MSTLLAKRLQLLLSQEQNGNSLRSRRRGRMIVSCARCKYQGSVNRYYDWFTRNKGSAPQLWICDICAQEVTR